MWKKFHNVRFLAHTYEIRTFKKLSNFINKYFHVGEEKKLEK